MSKTRAAIPTYVAKCRDMCLNVMTEISKQVDSNKINAAKIMLEMVNLDSIVETYEREKMVKELVDQICLGIDEAKKEILQAIHELSDEDQHGRLTTLIGKTESMFKRIDHFQDFPSISALENLLADAINLISDLKSELGHVTIPKYVAHVFYLYICSKWLYATIEFIWICKYEKSDAKRKKRVERIVDEIEQIEPTFNNAVDRLHKNIEMKRFSKMIEREDEDVTKNVLSWGDPVKYRFLEFEFDKKPVQVKKIKYEHISWFNYHTDYMIPELGVIFGQSLGFDRKIDTNKKHDKLPKKSWTGGYYVWQGDIERERIDAENQRRKKIDKEFSDTYEELLTAKPKIAEYFNNMYHVFRKSLN